MENIPINKQTFNNGLKLPKNVSDADTRDKIHKHLMDINDIITDEDIRRVKIDIPASSPAIKHSSKKNRK